MGSLDSVGVQATSHGEQGFGVLARAVSTTGTPIGVYAEAPSNGYALYAEGRFVATGTKSFRIDHPLDPDGKYLEHFCAEGPEPRNVYMGSVVTDSRGQATVHLPNYYSAINKDAIVQLTVVDDGDDFVHAKVTAKPTGNSFKIRTSKGGTEVHWRVDAVRNDPWVRNNGTRAEHAKP
jgi:hypothetical protein